ncbi:hypothetical protein FHW16_002811 [Phyllobacterium myrsinacearum]|uniref:Uncharacterized protein n=1 Tax=Phyllobacterium myrsinacearum TaxID=28101 RepID=A0A839EG07_9HYPH|nr:hypothetical protein [Phyllobacterium myrsinacearum]
MFDIHVLSSPKNQLQCKIGCEILQPVAKCNQ